MRGLPQLEMSAPRILVVDDDAQLRDALAEMLAEEGLIVESANDAGRALRAARRVKPAIILVDLGMPDVDGWELIRLLRAERTERRPHIIVMSGFTDARSRQLAFEAGGDQYNVKEAGADALVAAVRTFVLRAALR